MEVTYQKEWTNGVCCIDNLGDLQCVTQSVVSLISKQKQAKATSKEQLRSQIQNLDCPGGDARGQPANHVGRLGRDLASRLTIPLGKNERKNEVLTSTFSSSANSICLAGS